MEQTQSQGSGPAQMAGSLTWRFLSVRDRGMLDDLLGSCGFRPPDALTEVWMAELSVQEGPVEAGAVSVWSLLEVAAVNVIPRWEREL